MAAGAYLYFQDLNEEVLRAATAPNVYSNRSIIAQSHDISEGR